MHGQPPAKNDIWFPAKRYGWGWGLPRHRNGWFVLLAWFGAFCIGLWARGRYLSVPVFLGYCVIITLLLVFVCYRKGEPPRWRWGGD